MAGQIAYHLMAQAGMARGPWAVATIVSCLLVLDLSMEAMGSRDLARSPRWTRPT
jgi:hypothetical protein